MVALIQKIPTVYALFIDTLCEGMIPSCWDENGYPTTFKDEREAQLEIVDCILAKITQFQNGEYDFYDAISVEDQIIPVSLHADGSIQLETGQMFGKQEN